MKPWVLAAILMFSGTAHLAAQSKSRNFFLNEPRPFYGGFLFGMNMSTVEGDTYGGYHKAGLNGGFTVYAAISPSFLANLELIYTQKGSRGVKVLNSYYSGTFIEKYYLDLNYMEVPLVFHYVATSQLTVGVGGAYAQLINSKEDVYTDQPVNLRPDSNVFRKQDYSLLADAGFQIGDGLFFKARYQFSLTTIRDWNKIPVGYGYGNLQFNSLFSIRLMYLIK